jgi:hypothetical protein
LNFSVAAAWLLSSQPPPYCEHIPW